MPGDDHFPDDGDERTQIVNLKDLPDLGRPARDRHLLIRVQGSDLGQVIPLGGQVLKIGRHQDSEIWLRDDGVSRRHARIVAQGDGYVLEDVGSANGTFVSGQAITRHVLTDGDMLQFGPNAVLRYSVTDQDQEALFKQLYATSVTDSLTGIHNREYFDTQLMIELSYRRRHGSELAVVLCDLDHFKNINDTYGHPAGDAVLRTVAVNARSMLRAEDVLARYGGEEFAIVLRNIDLRGAFAMSDRLRAHVGAQSVIHDGNKIQVSLSGGCACASELSQATNTNLVELADRRLYAAKQSGRNRIVAQGFAQEIGAESPLRKTRT
jgi:diguanylate cyclase (GGDEF)-like protein